MHFRFPALMTPILGRTIRYYEGLVMHKNFSRKLRPDDLIKSEQELEAKQVPHSFKPKNKLLYLVYTIECGFTLKRVRDMTRTYSQKHRTDKYSEHSSIIWPVWPNG